MMMMLANELADALTITAVILPANGVIVNRDDRTGARCAAERPLNSCRSVRNLCVNGG